jgi:transcriptional regulator with XRE-family HTH domain
MSGPTLNDTVRARLRALRQEQGLTQDDLAKRVTANGLKMHETAITRIEKGTREMKPEELPALAYALGVSPIQLQFPLGIEPSVRLWSDAAPVPTWDAMKWWTGEAPYPGETGPAAEVLSSNATALATFFRRLDAVTAKILASPERGNPDALTEEERILSALRTAARSSGILLPELPAELAYIDDEGGPKE